MSVYRPKNEFLIALLDSRKMAAQNSGALPSTLHSGIGEEAGVLIGDLILRHRITRALEIGMANAFSTLFILDAIDQVGGGTMLSLDPFQSTDWSGVGLERVQKAAFQTKHELIEQPSWLAMPAFISNAQTFELIFIDGSHAFDNVFVDFYLSDKALAEGGFLVFDDVGWAGVERVLHYLSVNRSYTFESIIPRQYNNDFVRKIKEPLKRLGERISRTHRTPTGSDKAKIEVVNGAAFLALRKVRDRTEESFQYF